ncbi:MAG TPA: ATP-binding protein, partial [Chryseosolibacter sp.]|nr:ATP-binding protein [Chryseosolibacter sp.]
ISWANKAYQYGKSLNLTSGLARPLNIMGVGFNYKGERLLAYEYYNDALKLSVAQNDSGQIAHANNNIGRLFFEQGLLERSYHHFIEARSIFQQINDPSGLAYIYQSLGNLYKLQHDYRKSEESFMNAYRIRLALGNTRDIMSALLYIARLHQETSDWEKSIKYLTLADSTGQVIRDNINLAEIRTYLAESYLNVGRIQEAEAMGSAGLQVIEQLNNVRMKPQAYHMMGQIFLKKGALNKAEDYFTSSLEVATRIKDLNAQMKAYYDLWKIAERKGNEPQRLLSMNQYLVLKDSIKDLDLARRVERLQFEIEIQRKEQENQLLKAQDEVQEAEIEQRKLQNISLIVIVGFISIFGLMLWQNNRKRKEVNDHLMVKNEEIEKQREEIVRQNQKLSKRNQQLAELNHEKDTLMSIVAHDLKSPLNRIKGLTDLMELEGTLPEDQKMYVKMVKDATQSGLDLIIDLLDVHMLEENVEPTYTPFDLSKFLLEKIDEFTQAAEAKSIHLYITRVSSDEVYSDYDYLNRIMDNLLSNAIKFSERGSTVVVAADCLPDEFWISVKDHGPGFTSNDKLQLYQKFRKLTARPTGGETSNGLGLAIVKTLVDRLKGKIELSSEDGKGSEFVVRIPTAKDLVLKQN